MVSSQVVHEVVEGQTYWFLPSTFPTKDASQTAYLLPNYDEYIVGYTDRRAIFDASHIKKLDARGNVLFNHTIVIDGQVIGTWKRTMNKNMVILTPNFFTSPNEAETRAFDITANRYKAFYVGA